ncbi:hypothetical protein [Wenyingzhuangia sp. IMCC45574]
MGRSRAFNMALELSDKRGYKELKNSHSYIVCDSILVNHSNRTFFFTQRSVAKTIIQHSRFIAEVVS